MFARAILLRVSLVVCVAAALPACGRNVTTSGEARVPGGSMPLKLALVTDEAEPGRAIGEGAARGLMRAKADLHADVTIMVAASPAEARSDLTFLANQDFDEIFAVGRPMAGALAAVAKNYPRRRFAIVDANVDLVNVTSLRFRVQDGAFLAGALAALVTKTNDVAVLGDATLAESRRVSTAFAAGVKQGAPRVTVTNSVGGRHTGLADVVFVLKGARPATRDARTHGVGYLIAVDPARKTPTSERLLVSVVERADVAVFETALDAQAQKLPAGPVEFGLADDAMALTDLGRARAIVGPRRLETLARIRAAIVTGQIVPPTTPRALAAFRPVSL